MDTTTAVTTHRLTIFGPNLTDQSKGDFHVHAATCGDCTRYDEQGWTTEFPDRGNVVEELYSDQLSEHGDEKGYFEVCYATVWFAPCCDDVPEASPASAADAPTIDIGPEDNRRDQTAAEVMQVVHEEASAQNRWDILAVAFIPMDLETGIVRFRHGAGQFGTAWFRWHPGVKGDRVLFHHGHYDCDYPTSAKDFCERVIREA